jgi:hypothetical protein
LNLEAVITDISWRVGFLILGKEGILAVPKRAGVRQFCPRGAGFAYAAVWLPPFFLYKLYYSSAGGAGGAGGGS